MKVLLTGASGFIGARVLKLLLQHGINTIVAGRHKPVCLTNERFLACDLLDSINMHDIVEKAEATHLLHFAWYAEHGKYWTSLQNLRWVDATVRLTEAFCEAGGKQIVMAGTCAEYDWSYGYCHEATTPLNPATLYGVAKDATRRLVTTVCELHQTQLSWGRIFLSYGPGENRRRLIPSLIDVFDGKCAPFEIYANSYRDFLHVDDVASGFLKLLQNRNDGVFNICSNQPVQIQEIVRLIAESRNADPQKVLSLSTIRSREPAILLGNNQKIKNIGWEATQDIKEILRQISTD